MHDLLIQNATLVNEEKEFVASVAIKSGRISSILPNDSSVPAKEVIDASGLYLFPGVIDDQVHYREPGLTHKADIWHESRAAAAGGVTSFMEMPNTKPQTITQQALADKFEIGRKNSLVNYSFYMGATNDNLEELLKTDPINVCGIKIFMGSSTGNMLVDDPNSLRKIFSRVKMPIAVHCEDEETIQHNAEKARHEFGEDIPVNYHPKIRSAEACYLSSSLAVDMAMKYDTRLHILHLSTARETELFKAGGDLKNKQITAEVCVHHLWFNEADYDRKGNFIKWNPAIKTRMDQEGLMQALLEDKIDVIATDHAPHTREEKGHTYFRAPSGGPLVQHSLVAMLEFYKQGKISLGKIVQKMCHAPADIFHVSERGYIREGYWADLVLVNLNKNWKVSTENILSKCQWSPFEDVEFTSAIHTTLVNGSVVYRNDRIVENRAARALIFDR